MGECFRACERDRSDGGASAIELADADIAERDVASQTAQSLSAISRQAEQCVVAPSPPRTGFLRLQVGVFGIVDAVPSIRLTDQAAAEEVNEVHLDLRRIRPRPQLLHVPAGRSLGVEEESCLDPTIEQAMKNGLVDRVQDL